MFARVTCISSLQGSAIRETLLRNVSAAFLDKRNATATAAQPVADELSAARPYEDIPGPKPWPIVGNALRFIPGLGKDIFNH